MIAWQGNTSKLFAVSAKECINPYQKNKRKKEKQAYA